MALFTAIDATGIIVRTPGTGGINKPLILQNVGTVPISIYYNVDGAGDPIAWLAAGTANNDGLGTSMTDTVYRGPVWAKAPATGGRLLAR